MKLLDLVREVERELDEAGVPSARVDAELLVAHAAGVSRSALYAADAAVDPDRLRPLVARRVAREPLAYVLGEWGFRRLSLVVDRRVLVPRPETESVVGRCLARLRGLAEPRVLDVGTGSGAIALAIADEHPGARVTATDVSEDALAVARANAERTGLAVELVHGHLLADVAGPFDLVVSNPPYVEPDALDTLAPEVREWEPREALVGERLSAEIARDALRALRPGGWLVLECGDGQAPATEDLLRGLGYEGVGSAPDLTGRARAVEGSRPVRIR